MVVGSVEVETPRLLLRRIQLGDAPALTDVYAHRDVWRYLRPLDADATARQVERFCAEWEERGLGVFAVFDRTSGDFLGRSGLHYWPQFDEVEVGWVLRRDAWGNGYATEAASASLDWGFREHRLPAITAMIAKGNANSMAVAGRLKMAAIRDDHIFGVPVTVFSRSHPSAE